jgi:hypothetical protein
MRHNVLPRCYHPQPYQEEEGLGRLDLSPEIPGFVAFPGLLGCEPVAKGIKHRN